MRALFLGGEAINATKAAAAGLIVESAPAVDVQPVAITRARHLAEKPARAFAAHKAALDLVGAPATPEEADAEIAAVMDVWFGDEAQARRAALIEKLAKKG
jgi:enoyl-CoA hydratase/carnithine racemase